MKSKLTGCAGQEVQTMERVADGWEAEGRNAPGGGLGVPLQVREGRRK